MSTPYEYEIDNATQHDLGNCELHVRFVIGTLRSRQYAPEIILAALRHEATNLELAISMDIRERMRGR